MALTKEQALLISAYTGFLCVREFADLHAYIEKVLDRPVFTHEMADKELFVEIRAKLKEQFMDLIP